MALRVGTIVHETMVARRMLAYRHVLVAGRVLVERLGLPDSVEALHRFPCAAWSPGTNAAVCWHLGDDMIAPYTVLTTNDYAHLLKRALTGEVVTELPSFLVAPLLRTGELVALLPGKPMPEVQIHLLYPSHRHPSAIVRTYLDFCQQQVPLLLAP